MAADRRSRRTLGIALLSFTTVAWGLVPLVLKQVEMPTLAFASYRLWIGVALYGVIFLATGRRPSWATLRVTALGGVFFAADIVLTFTAFRLTSVANATIIGALAPVFISLGAVRWFGERLERRDAIVIASSFVGVARVGDVQLRITPKLGVRRPPSALADRPRTRPLRLAR